MSHLTTPHAPPRGFTLVEILVALILFSITATGVYSVLINQQRASQYQAQHIDMHQNIRAAAAIIPAELRELDAADGDIIAMAPDSIRIRAMRQLGFVCSPPVLGGLLTARTMTLRSAPFFGSRSLQVGDSLLVFYDGNSTTATDDAWVLAKITATVVGTCPDASTGTTLTVDMNLAGQPNNAGGIGNGAPVRGFETLTYRLFQQTSNSKWYLGMRNASGLYPLVGPLTGSTGVAFAYFDKAGAATAVPANVASIEMRLRAVSAQAVRVDSVRTLADSVVTRTALRNNRPA